MTTAQEQLEDQSERLYRRLEEMGADDFSLQKLNKAIREAIHSAVYKPKHPADYKLQVEELEQR